MKLSEGNVEFSLECQGYQFPATRDQEYDSDWLNIKLSLLCGTNRWQKTDPALLTFEVASLIDWLSEILEHVSVFASWKTERLASRCFFIEPDVGFEALNHHHSGKALTFRIYLAAEFMPPFGAALDHNSFEEDIAEVWIDFGVDHDELTHMIRDLKDWLQHCPVRVGLLHRRALE